MRGISTPLRNELTNPPLTLARLYKLTLTDNTVYRFTDHDRPILIQGKGDSAAEVYAASEAITASNVEQTSGQVSPNMELRIAYTDGLTREQMVSGLLDNASIIVSTCSWANTSVGYIVLINGKLQRKVVDNKQSGTWGVKGISKQLDGVIGEVYSEECRNELGDIHCGVNLAAFTIAFEVTEVLNGYQQIKVDFGADVATGYYTLGHLQLSGDLYPSEIINHVRTSATEGILTLALPKMQLMEVGMVGAIVAGCKKRLVADCLLKFDNITNPAGGYRGEPFCPTDDVSTTGMPV